MTRSYSRDAKSRMAGIQQAHKRATGGNRWTEDFSYEKNVAYGKAKRDLRGSYGMIDGLKTTKSEFDRYMAERRAADERARPGRSRSGWIGMSGRQVKQGECRVIKPAERGEMTLVEAEEKLARLRADYDPVRDRAAYRTLMNRIRQLKAA